MFDGSFSGSFVDDPPRYATECTKDGNLLITDTYEEQSVPVEITLPVEFSPVLNRVATRELRDRYATRALSHEEDLESAAKLSIECKDGQPSGLPDEYLLYDLVHADPYSSFGTLPENLFVDSNGDDVTVEIFRGFY